MCKTLVDELLDRNVSYVRRWHNKCTRQPENLAEHSYYVAYYSYILAKLAMQAGRIVSPSEALLLGLLHDATEVITGDVPGSLKRLRPDIRTEVEQWEMETLPDMWTGLPKDIAAGWRLMLQSLAGRQKNPLANEIVHFADVFAVYSFLHDEVSIHHNDALRGIRDDTALELLKKWEGSSLWRAVAKIDDSIGLHLRTCILQAERTNTS